MSKKIGIALIGLGTVGSSVLKILRENETFFQEEYDIQFQVTFVYVRNMNKQRNLPLEGITLTNDIEQIAESSQVDICIECMGGSGTEKTYDILMRLIENGKHIIMSSKKCLALYKNEFIDMVSKHSVQLRYDATVGGSIPICKMFQNLSGFDSVKRIYGIANATTNYILTTMFQEGLNYKEALQKAKENGYAENDVSEDVEGWDALYKMCILLRFGVGIDVVPKQMLLNRVESFENLVIDKALGKMKQIFYAERLSENRIGYYVGPVIVEQNTLLGDVEEKNNIIFVEHKYGGERAYYGAGAGGKETASIMVEDLIDMITHPIQPGKAKQGVKVEQMNFSDLLEELKCNVCQTEYMTASILP